MDELRYGVIGTGMMGVEHIHNLNALTGARVTAIADPHAKSRDAASAAATGNISSYIDHRTLLASGDCDALVIATPNMTHTAVLKDVLATSLPVLVEKPLCTTIQDCQTVIELAERREGIVWMGLEYRYMPPIARLITSVRSSSVGQVHMVAIREHRFPFLKKVDNWNRFSANTGGTLVEKCCHFFDLMNLIADSAPIRVIASGGQDVNHLDETYANKTSDILDNAYVIVEYENGIRGLLDLCMFAEATHNQEEVSVVGDKGKVEALIPENVLRTGRRGEHWIGAVEVDVVDDIAGHQGLHHGSSYQEHELFLAAVLSGGQPEVTLDDGLMSVAVGIAAHVSIAEARPVYLSELI